MHFIFFRKKYFFITFSILCCIIALSLFDNIFVINTFSDNPQNSKLMITSSVINYNNLDFFTNLSPTIQSSFFEKISNLINNKEKVAYLTFDDGPTLKSTPKILDILAQENVKASFFVIGKYVKNHPDLVKRAFDEGHFIANHGYDHNNKTLYSSPENFINEIKNTDIEISTAIGIKNYSSHVFRFPNGYMSPNNKSKKKEAAKLLVDMNYTYIDWNCLNRDSERKYSNNQLLNNFKKSSKNKGTLVILMHDTSDVNSSYNVLADSINYLKNEGYTFENFYNLIN